MPAKSVAQLRFMYATAEGKTAAPPSVGREFIHATHGHALPPKAGMAKNMKKRIGKTSC